MTKAKISVAKYLEQQIAMCGKSQREIAKEAGYTNPNIITMFKTGATKLPVNKVGPIAQALSVDPVFLFNLVMNEYMPDTYEALEKFLPPSRLIPEADLKLLELIRKATGGVQIDWTLERTRKALTEAVKTIAAAESAANEASVKLYNSKPRNAKLS